MTLPIPITFSEGGDALDRAAHLRPRSRALLDDPDARVLPLANGKLLIDLSRGTPALGWQPVSPATLAGVDSTVFLGMVDGLPRFTTGVPAAEDDSRDPRLPENTRWIDLRSIAGQLGPAEATIAATAKSILSWHETHGHCSRCGARSAPEEGGWRRRCPACGALHFPRTDPVVIMLILHGDRVLLGRQPIWPPGLYSLLAGFMEPGETIEDAVRREVMEETQVQVGRIRYLACQPWPFPSSLMLGCIGEALTNEIKIDPTELEDALWVSRRELADILAGRHERFASPRVDAIARSILTAWAEGRLAPV